MSAVAVGTLVEILVSVKRPVTSEGLISNVTPFPFDVEIFVVNEPAVIPPLRVPPVPIMHAKPLPVALKLPLLWAKATVVMKATTATSVAIFFMVSSPVVCWAAKARGWFALSHCWRISFRGRRLKRAKRRGSKVSLCPEELFRKENQALRA